ncbi:MAG: adenosylcobinamide-GDP ribazoletransferase [Pseudomonadota bacterium]
MKRFATNELAIFALAVQFLTRFPVPVGDSYTPARLAAGPRYYPLVGALVGAACAFVYLLTENTFTAPLAVVLALGAGLLFTGAFHEDGLADTFDGIGGNSRERALEIMRDSRLGTYGTLALCVVLAAKVAALLAMPPARVAMMMVVAHTLSRLSAVLVMASSQYVRDHGTGKPTADGIGAGGLTVAVLTCVLVLGWVVMARGVTAALCVVAGTLLGHLFMRSLFERRLGGYTGDTLGAVQQMSELGAYLGFLAWL